MKTYIAKFPCGWIGGSALVRAPSKPKAVKLVLEHMKASGLESFKKREKEDDLDQVPDETTGRPPTRTFKAEDVHLDQVPDDMPFYLIADGDY